MKFKKSLLALSAIAYMVGTNAYAQFSLDAKAISNALQAIQNHPEVITNDSRAVQNAIKAVQNSQSVITNDSPAIQAALGAITKATQPKQATASGEYSNLQKYNVKTPNQCPEHYPLGAPTVVSSEREKIERRSFHLCNSGYAAQFDPATKNPIWVAERLTRNQLNNSKEERTDDFKPNPFVPNPAQASLADYRGSKLDRGHMAPAADMYGISPTSMSESFFLTNMVPQVGPNQNRGIWAELEGSVRDWAKKRGELLVVTGPIYENNVVTMGKSKVWVPTKLYKVVVDPNNFESIAFVIPNNQIVTSKTRNLDKGNPIYPQTLPENAIKCSPQPCSIENFKTSIAEVERLTGLRFISLVRDDIRNQVTSGISGNWR